MAKNLSKSRYTLFRQCPKALWMSVYQPESAAEADQTRMTEGNRVGELAKGLFGPHSDTILPNESLDIKAMLNRTKELMSDPMVETICEAAFIADSCYCAVDLLHREKNGWAIYEVKSSTGSDKKEPDEVQIWDISYQYYVLRQCGVNVVGAYLVRLNSDYVLNGELNIQELFYINDVREAIEAEQPKIAIYCAKAKEVLSQTDEPAHKLHKGCNKPYECAFKQYCMQQNAVPTPGVFDLYRMNWDQAVELFYKGEGDLESLRKEESLKDYQRLQIEYTLSNKDLIDKQVIRQFLETIKYPVYHLDFESFQPVIPIYQGTKPYQQIPFQYSLHIEPTQGGECDHREFLADANSANPMRAVAEQLCKDIPKHGTVLVYNDNFEKGRLKEMANAFPDLAEHLLAIRDNVVDLLDPFQAWGYYRPAMHGSFSIKKVLPALFPGDKKLNYANLKGSVHNGGEAMDIFPRMRTMAQDQLEAARASLLEYCKLDTWSMVVILRKLYEIAK